MNGDVRLLIVAPIQLIFGCKLLVTGALLWSMTRPHAVVGHPLYWPLVLALVGLAALQVAILLGIALRREAARRLGVGAGIAGVTIATVLCVLAPLVWYFAVFVLCIGLLMGTLTGVSVIVIVALYAPLALLILTIFEPIGSFGVAFRRDFGPFLACLLFAWTAARLDPGARSTAA